MNTQEAVAAGRDLLLAAKRDAAAIAERWPEMKAVLEAVRNEGHIGPQECDSLVHEYKDILTGFVTKLRVYHSKLTLRCEDKGIDIPDEAGVQPRSGGGPR